MSTHDPKALGMGTRWRHLKTGGFYRVVYRARLEWDLTPVVVYWSEKDGSVWVRPEKEFLDGRFVEAASGG